MRTLAPFLLLAACSGTPTQPTTESIDQKPITPITQVVAEQASKSKTCFEGEKRAPLTTVDLSKLTLPAGKVKFPVERSTATGGPFVLFPEYHTYNTHDAKGALPANQRTFNNNLFQNIAHIVERYEVPNLAFEADEGPFPALDRSLKNGYTLREAFDFQENNFGMDAEQKRAFELAYSLYKDNAKTWQEKKALSDRFAPLLDVRDSLKAVFGQCSDLSFIAADVDDYNDYMINKVHTPLSTLDASREQLDTVYHPIVTDKPEELAWEYCHQLALYAERVETGYKLAVTDRNEAAVQKICAGKNAATIDYGASHVQDLAEGLSTCGSSVIIETDGFNELQKADGLQNPYDGSFANFASMYPNPKDLSVTLNGRVQRCSDIYKDDAKQ